MSSAFEPTDWDIANVGDILGGDHSHFSAHVMRLVKKADWQHRDELRTIYPAHVAAVENWERNGYRSPTRVDGDEYRVSIYAISFLWYRGDPSASMAAALAAAIGEWARSSECAAGMTLVVHLLRLGARIEPKELWRLPLEPVIQRVT